MPDQNLTLLVGQIDGKIDLILDGFKQHIEQDNRRFDAVNERVDKMEKKVGSLRGHWKFAAGMAAVITFFISNHDFFTNLLSIFPR